MEERVKWNPQDIGTGALLFAAGGLVMAVVLLAMRTGLPFLFWGLGWVLGPILLFLGGNALYRGLRSVGRDEL